MVMGDQEQIDLLLEELNHMANPWELVTRVRTEIEEGLIGAGDRHRFAQQYLQLVALQGPIERDALLNTGANVFEFRVTEARAEVDRIRRAAGGGDEAKIVTFLEGEEHLAEIIYSAAETPHVKFLLYRPDGTIAITDHVSAGGIRHLPPQSGLIERGVVLLPTGVEEYGTPEVLLEEIGAFIHAYVQLDNSAYRDLLAFYVLLTWIYDRFDAVPYLRVLGHLGSGKTRLIQTVGALSYRRIQCGGAVTASPIFRLIERYKGTFVVDEADFSKSDMWAEIIKIFNTGYTRDFPVLRSERGAGDDFEVGAYECYGPKILASRKRFEDEALESRCFSHTMLPRAEIRSDIPAVLDNQFRAEAAVLRNKLLLWRLRHYRHAVLDSRRQIFGLEPRMKQIVLPLLAVATSGPLERQLILQARAYQWELIKVRRQSLEGRLAQAIVSKSEATRGAKILIKELVETLESRDRYARITEVKVSTILRDVFGIETIQEHWVAPKPEQVRFLDEGFLHNVRRRAVLTIPALAESPTLTLHEGGAGVDNTV